MGKTNQKIIIMDRYTKNLKIVIAWNGLPLYGAKLIAAAREIIGENFNVIGTHPKVPIMSMDEILSTNLHWLDEGKSYSWKELRLEVPDVFFHTGWRYRHFISLADEVRARGGQVVGMFDNNWKGNFRQILGGIYFRLFLRKKYAAVFVPGFEGRKLARFLGFKKERIFSGLYGSSGEIFSSQIKCSKRPKCFLFVGQFIHRKGVLELVNAYKKFHEHYPEWKLRLIGQGDLADQLRGSPGILVEPFKQPNEIAKVMNEARVLILPSREEHWGLVVHEAALSGCGLLLTSQVGAAKDMSTSRNAIVIDRLSINALMNAMNSFAEMSDEKIELMQSDSLKIATKFGPKVWAEGFVAILKKLSPDSFK